MLNILQYKISVYKNAKNPTISDYSETDISLNNSLNTSLQNTSNNGLNYSGELHNVVEATVINLKKPITTNLTEIDLEILKDKELLIREQQNTIELLNLKIQKLEQLIQMKDRLLSQTIK